MTLLDKLLNPISPDTFRSDHLGRKPLLVKRQTPDYHKDICSEGQVDDCLRQSLLSTHSIEVVRFGKACPVADWARNDTRRDGSNVILVDNDKLIALRDKGASIVFNCVNEQFSRIGKACNSLSNDLGLRTQANIYITPAQSRGFPCHFDTHDVIVLQLSGSKKWQLFDSPVKSPVSNQSYNSDLFINSDISQEFELEAGDTLYIPRGLAHAAKSTGQASIHVTIGLHDLKVGDIFTLISSGAWDKEFFRASAFNSYRDSASKSEFSIRLRKELHQLVDKADLFTLFELKRNTYVNYDAINPSSDNLEIAQEISLNTIVSVVESCDFTSSREGGRYLLNTEFWSVSFPLVLVNSVNQALAFSTPFRVEQLEGLMSPMGKSDLVRSLVNLGLLKLDHKATELIERIESTPGMIPCYLDTSNGNIKWIDLGRYHIFAGRFSKALANFDTVSKLVSDNKKGLDERKELTTSLELLPLIRVESVEPGLLIFHTSRCGSTLLAKALAQSRSNVVFGEPEALSKLWAHYQLLAIQGFSADWEYELKSEFKKMILTMSRKRLETFIYSIFKFPSLFTIAIDTIAEIFPDTQMLFLYRNPIEVLASLEKRPSRIIPLRNTVLGNAAAGNSSVGTSAVEYSAKIVANSMTSALNASAEKLQYLNYKFLLDENFPLLLSKLNLKYDEVEIKKMQAQFNYYSKVDGQLQIFQSDDETKARGASKAAHDLCRKELSALYQELSCSNLNLLF